LGLTLSVHSDAFCSSPLAYLEALWWRLRRKRLRSRSQFARLLGHSRRAYDLWLLQEQAAHPTGGSNEAGPLIIALVDCRGGQGEARETLDSLLAEGITALLVNADGLSAAAEVARQIDWSREPWLMQIAAGDRVALGTAASYRAAICGTEAHLVYADDDLLDKANRRYSPHFKPDWNSELFRHFDYMSGACILRTTGQEMEALAPGNDWWRALVCQAVGKGAPLHIRKMLHHRRKRPEPHAPAAADVRVRDLPSVTVIVPTRNRVDLLRTCLEGVSATHYPDVEVIVVDNDSDDPETLDFLARLDPARHRVLHFAGAFNYSAINNHAVSEARGRLLCLLNNDIEVVEPNWLATMAVQAVRDDVGAVGARLLYPDGRIQHAGVVIGMGGAAGHAHRFLHPDDDGYFQRHALPQFASAVTAACLVVMRDRFLAVGGLDERHFSVAFNDVDLCLRLNRQGWQSLYEPRATLIHHESVSRGFDRDPIGAARFAAELAALQHRWSTQEVVDPFHHPELSRASERFVIRL
jgi:O-antigen biosynthesis protein